MNIIRNSMNAFYSVGILIITFSVLDSIWKGGGKNPATIVTGAQVDECSLGSSDDGSYTNNEVCQEKQLKELSEIKDVFSEVHHEIDCVDEDDRCPFWAEYGECENNPNYMLFHCQKSCQSCPTKTTITTLSNNDDMEEGKNWIEATLQFGERQIANGDHTKKTLTVIEKSVRYMEELQKTQDTAMQKILDTCINRHDLCAFWAAIGECDVNPAYMVTNCAPSCLSCDLIDFETRCPSRELFPEKYVPGLKPGELNSMFERIVKEGQSKDTNYTVTVHSGPSSIISKLEMTNIENDLWVSDGPWVVTFDNFLSHEECDRLIELGYQTGEGYQRSMDVGSMKFDGSYDSYESTSRTSKNAWCNDDCRSDPIAHGVMERLSKTTGIPTDNSEDLQLLRYEVGQFYRSHHDYIENQRYRQCGPRILTFFLYLNDVEAGGGTAFPRLNNLTVVPKKGRALLWPSVIDSDPLKKDYRTQHEALTVYAGLKFAANAWIHLYDFMSPKKTGCT